MLCVPSRSACFLIEEQRAVVIGCIVSVIEQRIRQRILKNCTNSLAFRFEIPILLLLLELLPESVDCVRSACGID